MKQQAIKTGILIFGLTVFNLTNVKAQSQERAKRTPPTFSELLKELDTDEDGKLSKTEIKGPLKESFAEIDTDEDGFISEEEFKKAPKPKKRERK
ncbi:EF-hand domain-containing protein [uncultured Olleya sp.]|uniref:EF-hand domain-containing protein n=1 Tax=uncultured Olleya sp. TaxID=757243 RepID=UPI0025956952|nr:EF-hand domain-containing protein [uncultured Olleya sp.]